MLPRGLLLRALAARRSIHASARVGRPSPPPLSRSTNVDERSGRDEDPPAAARTDKGKEKDRSVGRKSRASMLQAAQLAARAAQDEFVDPKTLDGRGSAVAGRKAQKTRRLLVSSSSTRAANEPTSPSAPPSPSSVDVAETSQQGASSSSHDAARPAVSRSSRPTFDDPYFDELFAPASFASKRIRSPRSGPSSRPAGRRSPRASDKEASPSTPREIGRQRPSRPASPRATAAVSHRISAPSAPSRGAARDAAPASRRPPSNNAAAADEMQSHSPAPQMDANLQATTPSSPPLAAKKAAKKTPTQQLPDDPAGRGESASPSSSASTRPTKEHAQAASQSETAGASEEFAVLPAGDTPPIHVNSHVHEAASATRPDAEPLPAALPLQVDEQPPPSSEAAEAAVQEVERSSSPPDNAAAEAPRPLSSSDAIVEEPHWSVRRPWALMSHSALPAKPAAENASSREPSRAAARKEASPAAPPPSSPSSPNASRKQPAPSQASRRKPVEVSLPEWLSLLEGEDAPSPSPSTPKDASRASSSARAKATSSSPGPIRPPSTARPVLPQQTTRPASPEQTLSAQSPSQSAQSTLPKPPTPPDIRGPFAELVSYLQSLGDYDTSAVKVSEEQQAAVDDGDGASTDASGSTDDGPPTTALKFKGSSRACLQVVEDFESALKRWSKNAYFSRRETLSYIDEAFQLYVSAYLRVLPADAQSTRLVRAFAKCGQLRPDWHPGALTLRALCDFLQQRNNLTANVMLLRLLRRQADSRRSMTGPEKFTMQRLCLQLLRSPSLLDRRRARTSVITAFTGGKDSLGSAAPLAMRCSLLLSWCQAGEGWAADASLLPIASNTEKDALETILADASYQAPLDSLSCKALEAITTWRAHGHSTASSTRDQHSQSISSFSPGLFQWLRKLKGTDILQVQAAHNVILDAVLPAIPASYQYAEEYQRLFRRFNDLGIKVGATAWQRAIESLLGRRRDTVVRAHQYPSRARRFKQQATAMSSLPSTARQSIPAEPDLMQLHEAILLYDASMNAFQPALAAAQPLVEALLLQFPPRIERAMVIWRRTQTQSKTLPVSDHGWLPFSRLGFFRRASDSSALDNESDLTRSPQKIAALAKTLLDFLLKTHDAYSLQIEGPELGYALEIVTDLLAQGRGSILDGRDRMLYTLRLLASLTAHGHRRFVRKGGVATSDDDFPETFQLWATLRGRDRGFAPERASAASGWFDSFDGFMYKDLAMALAGWTAKSGILKPREQPSTPAASTGYDSSGYDTVPLVPLGIIVDCVEEWKQRIGIAAAGMAATALITQFGRLCSYRQNLLNYHRRERRHESHESAWHAFKRLRLRPEPPPDQETTMIAIRRMGNLVMQHDDASPGPAVKTVGAYLEASGRALDLDVVRQIWRALILATANERGLDSQTLTVKTSSPLPAPSHERPVLTGQFVSMYLDAVSNCKDEAGGRRAWAFVGALDERSPQGVQIRELNAWTSWLEFLCRFDNLDEAVGPAGLEAMLSGSNPRPDRKTLSTVLAFARKRALDEGNVSLSHGLRGSADLNAHVLPLNSESRTPPGRSDGEAVFWTLKKRIQAGDFGQGMWDEIVEERPFWAD